MQSFKTLGTQSSAGPLDGFCYWTLDRNIKIDLVEKTVRL